MPIIMLIISSCTNKSATNKGMSYEDSIRQMINEQFKRDSLAKCPKHTPEDSLMGIISKLYGTDGFVTKYYNASKNTKRIVPYDHFQVPDSIVYVKHIYNGIVCGEGYLTFYDNRENDFASEVGKWKYCTPDGTKFKKYYKYTIGVQKDSNEYK